MGSTPASQLIGWTRTTLRPGDIITIYIWQSKTVQMVGRLNKIILADGTVMRDTQDGADNGGRADTDVGR
jgi:protein involved in polysaccharide export with SLBB domain